MTVAASARTAFNALVDDYEAIRRDVAACKDAPAHDRARRQLAYAARLFRIASFQAPAEGETHPDFDHSLVAIRKHLDAARREITT